MGIEPTYPSEKYGYIIPESTDHVAEVRTFREKPTADVAEQYIAQLGADINVHDKSDVLKFLLENNCSIVVRPSGTEPKLKTYISVSAENKEIAEKIEVEIVEAAETWIS